MNEAILATLLQQLGVFLSDASETHVWIHAFEGTHGSQELTGSLGWLDDRNDLAGGYVRKSHRGSHNERRTITCLDIGSIIIQKEYQGKGLFRSFVSEAHRLHPYRMTYIQSVANPLIEHWCMRNGWSLDPDSSPPSFFLAKETPVETQHAH